MNKMVVLALITMLAGAVYARDQRADEFPVVSYNKLDVTNFNTQISSASQKGESWVFHPFLIVQKFRAVDDTVFAKITIENGGGEVPLESTITVIEDGYPDDSVRGAWRQFVLERDSGESAWEVKEIRESYLCGRMNSPKEFSKELCP